jgi:hypothetical protein
MNGDAADAIPAGLIISHGHFLRRDAFRRTITAGTSISTGQPLAAISWDAALHALEAGLLACAYSGHAILRIAASLGDSAIPVYLRTVLGTLDTRNIALVTTAHHHRQRLSPAAPRGGLALITAAAPVAGLDPICRPPRDPLRPADLVT